MAWVSELGQLFWIVREKQAIFIRGSSGWLINGSEISGFEKVDTWS